LISGASFAGTVYSSNPTTSENRLLTRGRGIYLMKTLMDEASFEKSGILVRMPKKLVAAQTGQRRAE